MNRSQLTSEGITKEQYFAQLESYGFERGTSIQGVLGSTLLPFPDGELVNSTNGNIQVVLNGKGSLVMIIRILVCILVSLLQLTMIAAGQDMKDRTVTICNKVFFDSDSLVFKEEWMSNGKLDSTIYYDSKSQKVKGHLADTVPPKFAEGFIELNDFVQNNFTNSQKSHYQGKAVVMMIFRNGDIDFRVIKRIGYTLSRHNYDEELIRILNLKKPKWNKDSVEIDLPIIFFYTFNIPL